MMKPYPLVDDLFRLLLRVAMPRLALDLWRQSPWLRAELGYQLVAERTLSLAESTW